MDVLCKVKKQIRLPHHSLHYPNLHSECDSGLDLADNPTSILLGHEFYPFSATLPVPLLPPSIVDKSISNGADPALQLVYEKNRHNQLYKELLDKCYDARLPNDVEKILSYSTDSPILKVDQNIVTLAQHMSKDPCPRVNEDYNSYYGNTVAVCNVQDKDFVIYPSSTSQLNCILPSYGEKPCTVDEEYCVDHSIDDSQPVHQVQSSGGRVLLRLFKKCALFQLRSDDNLVDMQLISMNETEDSFITSCMNPFKNEYVTFTHKAILTIHNIDNSHSNRVIDLNFLENESYWGSVHYHDENVLMFCDRQTIRLLDLRTPINRSAGSQWDAGSVTEKCDSVYSSTKGAFLHYVCTDHFLLSLDIRKGWHQRWAHGMTCFPSLLCLVSKEVRDDSLLIGCQTGGSVANVHNSHASDFNIEFIKTPSFQLPSLTETLHQSRLKGHSLSTVMKSRFSMSLTGLSAIRNSSNVNVFLCNSVGDIFSQRLDLLNKVELFTPSLSGPEIERLDLWESECLQQCSNNRTETFASDVLSFGNFDQLFENSASSTDDVDCEPLVETESITSWAWTKQDLDSCTDILASQLLACWKLENNEWSDNFNAKPKSHKDCDSNSESEISDDSMEDVNQRIQEWLSESICENTEPSPLVARSKAQITQAPLLKDEEEQ